MGAVGRTMSGVVEVSQCGQLSLDPHLLSSCHLIRFHYRQAVTAAADGCRAAADAEDYLEEKDLRVTGCLSKLPQMSGKAFII